MDMRCDNVLHAIIRDGFIEVKCRSRFCGRRPGVVIIHRFNLRGELVETKQYKDTPIIKKEN